MFVRGNNYNYAHLYLQQNLAYFLLNSIYSLIGGAILFFTAISPVFGVMTYKFRFGIFMFCSIYDYKIVETGSGL